MTEDDRLPQELALAAQAARFLGLPLDPAYAPGVAANLVLLHAHAARILALDLPPGTEPAPVFAP